MNFKKFIQDELILLEILDPSNKAAGIWSNESDGVKFRFDVPSETCPDGACYFVKFEGDPQKAIDVSFGHRDTDYKDIEHESQSSSPKVIGSTVIQALQEYIGRTNPAMLYWSAAKKDRNVVRPINAKDKAKAKAKGEKFNDSNLDARQKIYSIWMKKHLFPNRYVPIDAIDYPQGWVRRDLYDSSYVPRGYPSVPQGKQAFQQFVQSLQQGTQNMRQSIDTDAQTIAQDPRHNPQRLNIGDQVYDASGFRSSTHGYIGQLIGFEMSDLNSGQLLPGTINTKSLCANVKWLQDSNGQPVDQETIWMLSTGVMPVATLKRANSNKQIKKARSGHSLSPPPQPQPLHMQQQQPHMPQPQRQPRNALSAEFD